MELIKASETYNQLLDPNRIQNCYYYQREEALHDRGLDFIKNYLRDGGKLNMIVKEKEILENDFFMMRCEHMRSLFLLGIYCYDNVINIRKAIDNHLREAFCKAYKDNKRMVIQGGGSLSEIPKPYNSEDITQDLLRKEFLYMWYLICLYHDIGYAYEDNALLPEQIYPNEVFEKRNAVSGIPNSYFNSIDRYYRLRKFTHLLGSKPCVDHGIYGGMRFYKTMKSMHSSSTIKVAEFGDNEGLLWGEPIFDNYLIPAAYCIVCHNMFKAFVESKDAQKYLSIDLHDLIIARGTSDILPSAHPLLFLLCMLDTIEPVKYFAGDKSITREQADEVLDNCELHGEADTLYISWNPKIIKQGKCRRACQYKQDTGKCATYSCMRTVAKYLDFLLSQECKVTVDAKWLKISINAWPAVAR